VNRMEYAAELLGFVIIAGALVYGYMWFRKNKAKSNVPANPSIPAKPPKRDEPDPKRDGPDPKDL